MTDPVGPTAAGGEEPGVPAPRRPQRRRRRTVAPASRLLAAGLSIGAACAIVTVLAMSQPDDRVGTVELEAVSGAAVATEAAPPPTTIVVNKVYVPVPAGGSGGTSSGASTGGASGGAPASSGASASVPAARPSPAPADTTAPARAPAARSRAS